MLAQFYAPVIGGEERMVETLSTELVARGHDVAVACLQHAGQPAEEERDGVRIYRLPSLFGRLTGLFAEADRRHAAPIADPATVRALSRILDREAPDVVHAHNWLVNSYLPLHVRLKATLVLSLHDYSLVCSTKRLMRNGNPCEGPALGRCTVCSFRHYGVKGPAIAVGTAATLASKRRRVDLFLPVSEAVAQASGLTGGELAYRVLPNFVPDDLRHHAESAPLPAGLPRRFVLYAGDLTYDKGVGVLLEARAALSPPTRLVLAGRMDGVEVPADVVALGPISQDVLLHVMRHAVTVVVPSITPEAFGLVALEAMTLGRPVIATNTGGLAELAADGRSAYLVPPNDADALGQALAHVVEDANLRRRMSGAARRRATAFCASDVVPRYVTAYEEALAVRGSHQPARRRHHASAAAAATGAGAAAATAAAAAAETVRRFASRQSARAADEARRVVAALAAVPSRPTSAVGVLAYIAVAAVALAVVSAADATARTGRGGAAPLLWCGLVLLVGPFAARLLSLTPTRGERLALVGLLGIALYAVKVMYAPFDFTFADELVHAHNAGDVLRTGHLFGVNSILPVTPRYPGLPSVTAAVASLTGLGIFGSGLLVIAVARLILVLGIFVLVEAVSGSSRAAGIAALVYAANPNFVFFDAQFAYESLALPLGYRDPRGARASARCGAPIASARGRRGGTDAGDRGHPPHDVVRARRRAGAGGRRRAVRTCRQADDLALRAHRRARGQRLAHACRLDYGRLPPARPATRVRVGRADGDGDCSRPRRGRRRGARALPDVLR